MKRYPMSEIAGTEMWQVGRNLQTNREAVVDPITAGIYVATMMAQADLLRERGHPYSEIVNESIIEAIDSLNPYMDFKDVAFMVDNCSTTARLGARKWAPRFDYALTQTALPAMDRLPRDGEAMFRKFLDNELHQALAVCLELRPPVSIAVMD
jgi:ketol-acid reductoisomerase